MLKSKVKAFQHHESVTEKNFCEMAHVPMTQPGLY